MLTCRLVDPEGASVADWLVVAFVYQALSGQVFRSEEIAVKVLEPMGRDLDGAVSGEVYLQAREGLDTNEPSTGEVFGLYGGSSLKELKPVKIKRRGRLDGLEIVVQKLKYDD